MESQTARLWQALEGRYSLIADAGHGGMAVVYRAHDLRHDRDVAVKVLRPELASVLGAERFLREIRISSRLQHPHILALHDSGESGPFLYYVMPFVEGESLSERLRREPQLPVDEALQITRDVGGALAYAHEQGVVHRDVKPGNILLSSGEAIVTDFGIAEAITEAGGEQLTRSGIAIGTPTYMSPEQAAGDEPVDGRSDVYSLGCVLYEMLTGDPPFTGRTAQVIISRQLLAPPPSLEIARPNTPPGVIEAVETALSKVPGDRFDTAESFVRALEPERVAVRRPPKRPARRRLIRTTLITVLVGAAALTGWSITRPAPAILDTNRVVVFPLREAGFVGPDTGTGDMVALGIRNALAFAQPLVLYDGLRWVNPASIATVHTVETQRDVGRGLGARYFISGSVVRNGDSASVLLALSDVAGDSVVLESLEEGNAIDVGLLGIRAAVGLLPALVDPERPPPDLSPILDRSPRAIALWLQGEREYSRAHFDSALDLYARALEEDSLLALAAVKAGQAASWGFDLARAGELNALALSGDSLLPVPYAYFARGFNAYLEGRADTAVAWYERAIASDPDWSEAHAALGEVFFHLLPARAPLDSLAEESFRAALGHDSTFAPPLFHLAQTMIRRGDLPEAERLYRRFVSMNPKPELALELAMMMRCVDGEAGGTSWAGLASSQPATVNRAATSLAVGAYQLGCAEQAFRALLEASGVGADSVRWVAITGLMGAMLARGRSEAAVALVDSVTATNSRYLPYFVLGSFADAALNGRAAHVDSLIRSVRGDDYSGIQHIPLLWYFGVWNALNGNLVQLLDIQRAAAAAVAADTSDDRRIRLVADIVDAHVTAATGGDPIAAFEQLRPTGGLDVIPWQFEASLPVERLRLAEFLLERGEYERAYEVATVFDHPEPLIYIQFVPASLRIRYQAARALARDDLASQVRDRLIQLGRDDLIVDLAGSP